MNKSCALLSIALLTLLSGCASTPTADIEINAQSDPKARFTGYETYAWIGSAAILHDEIGRWEPPAFDADAEVKHLIDRELRKRGMSESRREPDLLVAFAAGIDLDTLALRVDPQTEFESLVRKPKGALVIALVDAETRLVIWVGAATADVREDPDEVTGKARLDYAVTQMLSRLPD